MKMIIAILALLTGCQDVPLRCKETCAPNPVQEMSATRCTCYSQQEVVAASQAPAYGAEKFCAICARNCKPFLMKSCRFGNDTWGAGPDTCECSASVDAGT